MDGSLAIVIQFMTEEVEVGVGGNIKQHLILERTKGGVVIQNERIVLVRDEGGDLVHVGLMSDVVGHALIIARIVGYGNRLDVYFS